MHLMLPEQLTSSLFLFDSHSLIDAWKPQSGTMLLYTWTHYTDLEVLLPAVLPALIFVWILAEVRATWL